MTDVRSTGAGFPQLRGAGYGVEHTLFQLLQIGAGFGRKKYAVEPEEGGRQRLRVEVRGKIDFIADQKGHPLAEQDPILAELDQKEVGLHRSSEE